MSKLMSNKNIIGALGIAVLTCVYLVEALKLDFGSPKAPGEGFMPIIAAILVILLCAVLFVSELIGKKETIQEIDMWEEDEEGESTGFKKPIIVIISLIIYPLILTDLGFILSTIPLIFINLRTMKYRNWVSSLIVSIIATLVAYFVFSSWLSVYFPKGILG
ncbi:tripartite tricarboxylate transporter TctB family protein [Desulfitobacterium sp. AusDCA]|uniref:tripartite tricarboxylate transporter TctB family protein n=1 Tax=Desulfitobacterium sp. AusDCA TaxID=3240383 RepID=UPI003DA71B35